MYIFPSNAEEYERKILSGAKDPCIYSSGLQPTEYAFISMTTTVTTLLYER